MAEVLTLPVLPLDDEVVLPGMVVPIELSDTEIRGAIEAARNRSQGRGPGIRSEDKAQVLLVPRLGERGLAAVGTLAVVDQIGRLPGGGPGADPDPGHAAQDRARLTTGQPAELLDHGQRAHGGQAALTEPRHKQHLRLVFRTYTGTASEALVAGRLDGAADFLIRQLDRDDHAGQHDLVVEWQHRQGERLAHERLQKLESPTLKKEEPSYISPACSS